MPKINLKPNSPEFADKASKATHSKTRACDMPGCRNGGEFRAPKSKELNDYHWFCQEHVQEYNKAWNFFEGMSIADMEDHIARATVWDRPTKRFDNAGQSEALKRKAWQTYNFTDEEPPQTSKSDYKARNESRYAGNRQTPEFEALAIMGLEPPITLEGIKSKYKELAKKFHPDLNPDDPNAEELLKKINMAYTVLKVAYQKFGELPEKK